MTWLLAWAIGKVTAWRVAPEVEREGVDNAEHQEVGYRLRSLDASK